MYKNAKFMNCNKLVSSGANQQLWLNSIFDIRHYETTEISLQTDIL